MVSIHHRRHFIHAVGIRLSHIFKWLSRRPKNRSTFRQNTGKIKRFHFYILFIHQTLIPLKDTDNLCVRVCIIQCFCTPRIVAFRAWQSPPLVKKATRLISASLSKVRVLDTFFSLPYFVGLGNSGMNFVCVK